MNLLIKYVVITIISCIYVELIGYLSHRYIIHEGIIGNFIRVTHYCHHEKKYPYNNFDSKIYRTAHDTWPWILIIIIFAYINNIHNLTIFVYII